MRGPQGVLVYSRTTERADGTCRAQICIEKTDIDFMTYAARKLTTGVTDRESGPYKLASDILTNYIPEASEYSGPFIFASVDMKTEDYKRLMEELRGIRGLQFRDNSYDNPLDSIVARLTLIGNHQNQRTS